MFFYNSICYTCYTNGVDSVRGEVINKLISLLRCGNYEGYNLPDYNEDFYKYFSLFKLNYLLIKLAEILYWRTFAGYLI